MSVGRVIIIEPSGVPDGEALAASIAMIEAAGLEVDYRPCVADGRGRSAALAVAERGAMLAAALAERNAMAVFAARGGYGASELLERIDWTALATRAPLPVIGFSDVSALHSALLARLGWPGVHGPMPGSRLWSQGGADIAALLAMIAGRESWRGVVVVTPVNTDQPAPINGWLFGGCLSVLTNLIGTPFIPASLAGAILFVEDINETPERMLRYWTQWRQSGLARGLRAVVVGSLRDAGGAPIADREFFVERLAERAPCPVFASDEFGHQAVNRPLAVGAPARIEAGSLSWSLADGFRL